MASSDPPGKSTRDKNLRMTDSTSSQVRFTDGKSSVRGPTPVESSTAPDHAADDLTVISVRGPLSDMGDEGPLLKPLEVGKMLEGERLGQFVLECYVGGGGMGVVFQALDTTLNREVAVKVLAHSQSRDEETLRRFKNEAQSAARLDHDNIARVYYVGEDRGVHYIVFEFIEGVNIRDLVQRDGPLSLADAISYTLQVAEALSHASQRDVIHRDIKPSNVLITPEGRAKLVDMGLARLHQVEHPDNDLTASGVTLGTFDYISPEQARDPRSADVRSDLYSLGCSFYFMLTGRPPFPEGTVLQKLLQHQSEDPVDPRQFRPDLPVEIGAILARLLAKNPARRYQSPAELIADLNSIAYEGSSPRLRLEATYGRPVRMEIGARWRRHIPWLVPIVALVLIVATVAVYDVWSGSPLSPEPQTNGEKGAAPASSDPGAQAQSASPARVKPAAPRSAVPTDEGGLVTPAGGPMTQSAAEKRPDVETFEPAVQSFLAGALAKLGLPQVQEVLHKAMGEAEPPAPEPAADRPDDNIASGAGGPNSAGPNSPAVAITATPSGSSKPAPRPGVLVVASNRQGEGIFASVQAAVSAAANGDVVELDFNGRREERPLELANKDLTLRAANGRRPVLLFRPPADADAISYPRSMLVVAGGSLSMIGIELELEMPRKISADTWALFEIRRAERLRLERTTLTIRNSGVRQTAFHADVSFFDLKTPPGGDTIGIGTTSGVNPPLVELVDCVLRGEATCLRTSEFEPVRLAWTNGFLFTSESLLLAQASAGRARTLGGVEISLRRVTAIARRGLARLSNNEDLPYLLDTEISCNACVLVTDPSLPLVEQRGIDTVDQFREHFQWSANNVDFEGVDQVAWRIVNTPTGETSDMDFAAWESYWDKRETDCRRGALPWLTEAAANGRLSELSPADLGTGRLGELVDAAMTDIGGKPERLPIPSPMEAIASPGSEPPAGR
ncbi:MAG TPA: protein kinase [Pirellulales bacterium]|jgi:serine/threonine-protein kinase|nr:protein kinase [Pirellulales bacterium]